MTDVGTIREFKIVTMNMLKIWVDILDNVYGQMDNFSI